MAWRCSQLPLAHLCPAEPRDGAENRNFLTTAARPVSLLEQLPSRHPQNRDVVRRYHHAEEESALEMERERLSRINRGAGCHPQPRVSEEAPASYVQNQIRHDKSDTCQGPGGQVIARHCPVPTALGATSAPLEPTPAWRGHGSRIGHLALAF